MGDNNKKKEKTPLIEKFVENLQSDLNNYSENGNMKYKVLPHRKLLSNSLGINNDESKFVKPKRGYNAFEVDIAILRVPNDNDEKGIPMIAIELKTGSKDSATTHDILVSSSKAHKHKVIFPWLRYGLIWFNDRPVTSKFFKNNEYIDFAGGISNDDIKSKKNKWNDMMEILKDQLETAEEMYHILSKNEDETKTTDKAEYKFYSSKAYFEKIQHNNTNSR